MAETSRRFLRLVEATRTERDRVRALVASGQWRDAEPDPVRARAYAAHLADRAGTPAAEAVQGLTADYLPARFLARGAEARRAVAYIEVNLPGAATSGSGFLVSNRLLLTNAHVIPDAAAALAASATFDREAGPGGRPLPTTNFALAPDLLALFSREDSLDYALVALGDRISGTAEPAELGACALTNTPDRHRIGAAVNIIQHPNGWPKQVSLRNNLLTNRTRRTLLYQTDTDHGSSGSPVFNDAWELIALHHYGAPFLETLDETGVPIPLTVNEGVRISAIVDDLTRRLPELGPAARALLEAALAAGAAASAPPALSPRPARAPATATTATLATPVRRETTMPAHTTITLPLTITVSLGDGAPAVTAAVDVALPPAAALTPATVADTPPAPGSPAPAEPKRLTRASERVRLDPDYGDLTKRAGFDPAFLSGFPVPLPTPTAELSTQVAPLRTDEPGAATGELRYTHFSCVLNKVRRVAMVTAVNIDGATYKAVDRDTGQVSATRAEGDTWFLDPRVSQSFYLDQSFYSAWSDLFDRGHLVRRSDPTWGDATTAERANADTFHFTNCSPQHFRFNQSARYWQGAERYVLENGALDPARPARLSVLQGPIYSDAIDRYADDVQIPSSFFKVIAWVGAAGPRAVGLVVDQLALLDETRTGMPRVTAATPIDVRQWRVPITTIAARAGLDFGPGVLAADSFGGALPGAGEAQVLIASMADLLAV